MPGPTSLFEALLPLRPILEEVWATIDDPDYCGGRWLELYHGNPMDERFIVVDAVCNVLHVQRRGRDSLTVTYIPGWLFEVATLTFTLGPGFGTPTAHVEDLGLAEPLRLDLWVETETAQAPSTVDGIAYARLPFGYEYEPAHAVAGVETSQEAAGRDVVTPAATAPTIQEVHWTPMRLRLVAAPGVRFSKGAVLPAATVAQARAAWPPHDGMPLARQALGFELHRRQDPGSLPGLGAPWMEVPLATVDLAASAAAAGDARQGQAFILEQTRPDGVDIVVVRPAEGTAPASWLGGLAVGAVRAAMSALITAQGGIPDDAPILIRIRVDPASAADRFAYRLTYLDQWGQPWTEPTDDVDTWHPVVRLAVLRTAGVRVSADLKLSSWGESTLERIIEYVEDVVHFDDVPAVLTEDDEPTRIAVLPDQQATLQDLLTVLYYVGMFVPHPAVQVLYDLEDAGSLATWLYQGTDVWGEEWTALDVGLTVAGLVVPEVVERGAKRLMSSVRRIRTVGDDPFARLVVAGRGLDPDDAELAQTLLDRNLADRLEAAP